MSDKKLTRFHKLDRTQPFGEVSPPQDTGGEPAHYDQHGFLYDAGGNLIEQALTDDQKAKLKYLVAKAEADETARKARSEALRKAGFSDEEVAAEEEATEREEKLRKSKESNFRIADIDLKGWALGQVNYPFDKVQAKIREKHGRLCTKFIDAIHFVGEAEGLPEDSLRKAA